MRRDWRGEVPAFGLAMIQNPKQRISLPRLQTCCSILLGCIASGLVMRMRVVDQLCLAAWGCAHDNAAHSVAGDCQKSRFWAVSYLRHSCTCEHQGHQQLGHEPQVARLTASPHLSPRQSNGNSFRHHTARCAGRLAVSMVTMVRELSFATTWLRI